MSVSSFRLTLPVCDHLQTSRRGGGVFLWGMRSINLVKLALLMQHKSATAQKRIKRPPITFEKAPHHIYTNFFRNNTFILNACINLFIKILNFNNYHICHTFCYNNNIHFFAFRQVIDNRSTQKPLSCVDSGNNFERQPSQNMRT